MPEFVLKATVKLAIFIIVNVVPFAGEAGKFRVIFPPVFNIINDPPAVPERVCGEEVPVIESGVSTLLPLIFKMPVIVVAPGPIVTAPEGVEKVPEEAEKSTFPDVTVRPLEAVRVPDEVRPPAIVCAEPKVLIMKSASPPASRIVYVLAAEKVGAVKVTVLVTPKRN